MPILYPWRVAATLAIISLAAALSAQSGGNAGSISGTVLDPTGAVVPNATVEIKNPVSHFDRSVTSDKSGRFVIPNVPFNPYHMTVAAAGFSAIAQDVEVRSVVTVNVKVSCKWPDQQHR